MKHFVVLTLLIALCHGRSHAGEAGPVNAGSRRDNRHRTAKEALSRELSRLFEGFPFDSTDAYIDAYCVRNGFVHDTANNLRYNPGYSKRLPGYTLIRGTPDSVRLSSIYVYNNSCKKVGIYNTLEMRETSLYLKYGGDGRIAEKDFARLCRRLKKRAPGYRYAHINEDFNGGIANCNSVSFYWNKDGVTDPSLNLFWFRFQNRPGTAKLIIQYWKKPVAVQQARVS